LRTAIVEKKKESLERDLESKRYKEGQARAKQTKWRGLNRETRGCSTDELGTQVFTSQFWD
jgi:hypothetical protein